MSARYAPLPNPRTDPLSNPELDAAFDGSDDEEADESHPLNAISSPSLASPSRSVAPPDCRAQQPSAYDFDSPIPDYDRPPPGSPPPSAHPLPTTPTVNPNGVFTPNNVLRRPTSWWKRASAVLPTLYVPWFGVNVSEPRGRLMGGGTANDGVFKNMSAKPTGSRTRVPAGESTPHLLRLAPLTYFLKGIVYTSSLKKHLPSHHHLMRPLKLMPSLLTIRLLYFFPRMMARFLKAASSSMLFPPVHSLSFSGTRSSAPPSNSSASSSLG